MELPKRPLGDEYTRPGFSRELSRRLAANPKMRELTALIFYAFDMRTRLLPFLFADSRILPAGPRAVADALDAAGLTKSRIVFQLWSPNVKPSKSLLDGRPPDILMVSSMQIHAGRAYDLVADAHRIPESLRPLILTGGPKSIYEPWDYFAFGEDGELNADVSVTGESFVLLALLDRLLQYKNDNQSLRQAFIRARDANALEDVPGLATASIRRAAGSLTWSTPASSASCKTSMSWRCRSPPSARSSRPTGKRRFPLNRSRPTESTSTSGSPH
jgi:hypothetical protein